MSKQTEKTTKPNRLINETSTYLLQHAHNPVDWYAWGPEALSRAKAEDKPILLSIGYAACHWCHVMEHESFENADTAALMNQFFVNIKVDREERTDLDEIYMKAVQMMTGHGGWPMTVFLTPELKPFFGGTYYPPEDRHGLPGFKRLLRSINEAWTTQREDVVESSQELTNHLKMMDQIDKPTSDQTLSYSQIELAVDRLLKIFDPQWGGFGAAPKFPHTFSISLAMRSAAVNAPTSQARKAECLQVVNTTLNRMAYGGMQDQIGGGFARYSVDRQWLVPHFEKMLYDNALLCQCYLEGYVLTGRKYWADVATNLLDFVSRELTTEDGAFFSSLDADSEGEEGKFYVWDRAEIVAVLGKDADWYCDIFGVTPGGNFEHGTSVLHLTDSPEKLAEKSKLSVEQLFSKIKPLSKKLFDERSKRIRPGRDEKVLTSWNSLMITAFVDGYKSLHDEKYLVSARRATEFILANLVKDGRLLRTWGAGKAKLNGYVDDYSYFVQALLDLASVDPDPKWLEQALKFSTAMIELFWDDQDHGFFYTSHDHEELVTRPKSYYDGAIPSGASVAVMDLLRIAKLTGDEKHAHYAELMLKLYSPYMAKVPDQFSNFLCGIDYYLAKDIEIAVVAPPQSKQELEKSLFSIYSAYVPNKVVVCGAGNQKYPVALLEDRVAVNGKTTVYICQNFSCAAPITESAALESAISLLAGGQP